MDVWIWVLLGFAVAVLVSVVVLGQTRGGRRISFWPWIDTTSGGRDIRITPLP